MIPKLLIVLLVTLVTLPAWGQSHNQNIIPSSAGTSYAVNTSAVTANSEIIVHQTTDNSGLPSSSTCTTNTEIPAVKQMSRNAGTSFTLSGLSNPAAITCF